VAVIVSPASGSVTTMSSSATAAPPSVAVFDCVRLVAVGTSFTAVTCSVIVSVADWVPPAPVLPLSLIATVNVTLPVAFSAVVYITLLAAINALTSAIVPANVSALAVPPTITPPPLVAASEPPGTDNVTIIIPGPASTSAKLMPVSAAGTSSVTAMVAGAVITGASFTAVTVTEIAPSAGPVSAASRMRVVIVKSWSLSADGVKATAASAAFTSATGPV